MMCALMQASCTLQVLKLVDIRGLEAKGEGQNIEAGLEGRAQSNTQTNAQANNRGVQ